MTAPPTRRAIVMVVDDRPANLGLLETMLRHEGYRVRPLPRGRLALAAAAKEPPDLILLDINMPEMNGYEVCRHLKANEALAAIPVIFLSARTDTADKVNAFTCGGVDYITKPFQVEEVCSRVRTHLEVRRMQRELEEHNAHLDELVCQRSRQLAEAHARLAILDEAKTEFLHLISHELRTPLNGLFGVSELLFTEFGQHGDTRDLHTLYERSRARLLTIIEHALLLAQVNVASETFASEEVVLSGLLADATEATAALALSQNVRLGPFPRDRHRIYGEPQLVTKALLALLETAVKFTKPGETVRLSTALEATALVLRIEAHGHSIPAPALPGFFRVFGVGESSTTAGDIGLRPAVAQRIVALFGGRITVENLEPPGIRFTVSLRTPEAPAVGADPAATG